VFIRETLRDFVEHALHLCGTRRFDLSAVGPEPLVEPADVRGEAAEGIGIDHASIVAAPRGGR
jgi:hypothetical protein